MEMNLATPPFDDQNVRKALNWALDKEGFRQLRGGPMFGDIAGHIMVNSLQSNQLKDYDPYPSPNGRGDQKAMEEMAAPSTTRTETACATARVQDVLTISDRPTRTPSRRRCSSRCWSLWGSR